MTDTLERVMHVDDDSAIRMVTRLTLERVGKFHVLSCESGQDALQKAGYFDPQVLLLDVMMPDMDGPATLLALSEQMDLSKRLVLFLTAKVQQQELDHYHSIGAWAVIEKPFEPMELPGQVRRHWLDFQTALDVGA